ncbi:hypothetical protein ACFY00_37390 [Kitasatospora sp. NPDC001540]|uniref:hypothetical protein n=1 Tax=Kitasatospora sp. NPDC001540 TaxID=3364014 RepID=UPI0036C82359
MTHSPHQRRRPGLGSGLTALLSAAEPTGPSASASHRAAVQLLLLREAAVPVPVLTAAVELLGLLADSEDAVTQEAAAQVAARLRAAAEATAVPGR